MSSDLSQTRLYLGNLPRDSMDSAVSSSPPGCLDRYVQPLTQSTAFG